jgi:hypothetical protein
MTVAFSANGLGGGHRQPYCRTELQPSAQFIPGWAIGRLANLIQQVIRKRHSHERRTRFKLAMQRIRHISDLDHDGHVNSMHACGPHVKLADLPVDFQQR